MVYPRHGFETVIPEELSNRVKLIEAPIIELSSTNIRAALKEQRNMNFFLSNEVYEYILENKLYT